jgi:hypothetical protein
MTPEICPNCGEMVPEKAKACPECGACEETGWSDEAKADALGIPDDSFDYDEYVKREFEGENPKRKFGALWVVTAIVLLGLFVWYLLSPHVPR